jgi:adenylyltransferase/sulfurtransferase
MQAAEAIKILIADPQVAPLSRDLVVFDLWQRSFEALPLAGFADPDCPACRGTYEHLEGKPRTRVTSLCGQNAVQIWDTASTGVPLAQIEERLSALGPVESGPQMVRFPVGEQELVVFYDGRTIVRGTRDEKLARTLYAKYVGT